MARFERGRGRELREPGREPLVGDAPPDQELLDAAAGGRLSTREQVAAQAARLRALSPHATLSRGYAIVELAADGHVLHDAASSAPGQGLRIELHRGRLTSTVDAIEPES